MNDFLLVPTGTPHFINDDNFAFASHQEQIVLEDGRSVIVWSEAGVDGKDIFAQVFTLDGVPEDDAFRVNTTTLSDQVQPIVTALNDGGFVVTWQSFGQDNFIPRPAGSFSNNVSQQYGIYQRVYDNDARPVTGEFGVNDKTVGDQRDALVIPLADGGYVTLWRHFNYVGQSEGGQRQGINLQRFDENGQAIGDDYVLPGVIPEPYVPDQVITLIRGVTALADGNVAVAWAATGNPGVFVTVFTPSGEFVAQFDGTGDGSQGYFEMTPLPDGNIFLAHTTAREDGRGLIGRVVSPEGEVVTPDFEIDGGSTSGTRVLALQALALSDGNILVTYIRDGIHGQIVSPTGDVLTDRIQLSLPDVGTDPDAVVRELPDGQIQLTYLADYQADGQIVVRRFSLDLSTTGTSLTNRDDNFVVASETGERVAGRDGDDTISGNIGDDALFGGAGADHLSGEDGADFIQGGAASDLLFGGDGDDHLESGAGDDTLRGGEGDDFILVADGHDRAYGDGGDDVIHSESRWLQDNTDRFVLYGGAGDDVIRLEGNRHFAYGGAGNDTIDAESDGRFYGGDGDDIVFANDGTAYGDDGVDTLRIIVSARVNVIGGEGSGTDFESQAEVKAGGFEIFDFSIADTGSRERSQSFIGGDTAETVSYTWGNFKAEGAGGDDVFFAKNTLTIDRNDILVSDVTINGGSGNDSFFGGTADDRFNGGDGDDLIMGKNFNDALFGKDGNDLLYGGNDSDKLFGGRGSDSVFGGNGNDYIKVGGGRDYLDGGSGTDYVSYYDSRTGVTLDLQAQTASGGWATNDTVINFEGATGSYRGGDRMTGSDGANIFRTYGGRDVVSAGKGDDFVDLGAGNDFVRVGGGEETFIGGTGRDTISYFLNPKGIRIDLRDDEVSGGWANNDVIDSFENASGSNIGADTLLGTGTGNTLQGYGGNDRLYGRGGNDKLVGGQGQDYLDGGNGHDELLGGAGADTFHFDLGEGSDTIRDFEYGVDRIEIDGLPGDIKIGDIGIQDGSDVVFDFGGGDRLRISDVELALLEGDLFLV